MTIEATVADDAIVLACGTDDEYLHLLAALGRRPQARRRPARSVVATRHLDLACARALGRDPRLPRDVAAAMLRGKALAMEADAPPASVRVLNLGHVPRGRMTARERAVDSFMLHGLPPA